MLRRIFNLYLINLIGVCIFQMIFWEKTIIGNLFKDDQVVSVVVVGKNMRQGYKSNRINTEITVRLPNKPHLHDISVYSSDYDSYHTGRTVSFKLSPSEIKQLKYGKNFFIELYEMIFIILPLAGLVLGILIALLGLIIKYVSTRFKDDDRK